VAAMPNQLWGEPLCAIGSRTMASDFTYVSTWAGMVYVAFIIDVFARKVVGWRVSTSMTTGFVLDALNQAICQRCPTGGGLIHHSDRGSQYLSIRNTERLADAGIDTSVGSVGDSYDNALAESIIHSGAYAAPLGPRSPPYVQDRGHQLPGALEIHGPGRVGDPAVGQLV